MQVLAAGEAGGFDSAGVSARCVLRAPSGAGWLMFYEAQDGARQHSIGLARSTDGVEWKRCMDSPVLEHSPDTDAWDGAAVARPWVVPMADGLARMYYLGRDVAGAQGIGMAESDGADWTSWRRVQLTPFDGR